MQLKRIQDLFDRFKTHLRSPEAEELLYVWESQRIFQQNWDDAAPGFADMYDRSLDSPVSRRLWSRENYAPKFMMLEFAALQPEMLRIMFRDLFNEVKDIEGRLDRFVFYCNELLQEYKGQNQKPAFNRHFHDDNYQMTSLYLAFRYPDRYAPYDHEAFRAMLRQLGSPDIPETNDPARFFKVARTLFTMMKKDAELSELHAQRLQPEKHYTGESLLLVYAFCRWCAAGCK
jgi:hypothetical protein